MTDVDNEKLRIANDLLKAQLAQTQAKLKQLKGLEQQHLTQLARSRWIESGGSPEEFDSGAKSMVLPHLSLDNEFNLSGWDKAVAQPGMDRHFRQGSSAVQQPEVGSAWDRVARMRERQEQR